MQIRSESRYKIWTLILAGEAIFMLPFVLARVFRPTFLDVFHLNNVQLGNCFSIYGGVALISYFFGGGLSDRYAPRKLIAWALFFTALGGIVMASYPNFLVMKILFGYWGATTIFLFWGAMIRATREWGGVKHQGKAFGFLEGGRGFVSASMGGVILFIFSFFIGDDVFDAPFEERQRAFKYVILSTSLLVMTVGVLVYLFMESSTEKEIDLYIEKIGVSHIKEVLLLPSVWWLMVIILCSYVGYKLMDLNSLYAKEVMGVDEVEAAKIGLFQMFLRPVVCVFVGVFADKYRISLWIIISFIAIIIGALIFALGWAVPGMKVMFVFSLVITAMGSFALRTLYFAIYEEAKIPLRITGTATGIVSVVGFTPDIFVGPMIGPLLDNYPGLLGFQYVFILLIIFSLVGMLAGFGIQNTITNRKYK